MKEIIKKKGRDAKVACIIASEIINSSKLLNDIRRGNTIETRF